MAVEYGCHEAPAPLEVDGGWLFSDLRVQRLNCVLSACQADRDYLRDAGFTTTQTALIAGASSLLLGFLSAYSANRISRHLPLF